MKFFDQNFRNRTSLPPRSSQAVALINSGQSEVVTLNATPDFETLILRATIFEKTIVDASSKDQMKWPKVPNDIPASSQARVSAIACELK